MAHATLWILSLHVLGPSGLASPIPDLKHHQLEVSVKIKQPRKPRAISRNANPSLIWSRLDNFCTLLKQKCKECLRNSWGESNQEDDNNNKKKEVDVKKNPWCAANSSGSVGKRPPQESKQMMLGERKQHQRKKHSKETELRKESESHKTSRENTKQSLIREGKRNNVQQIAESIGN